MHLVAVVPLCCSALHGTLLLLQVGHMLQLLGQPGDILELSYCLGPPSEESTLGSSAGGRLQAAQPSEAGVTSSGAGAEAAATPQRLAAPPRASVQGAVLPSEAAAGPAANPQRLAASLPAPETVHLSPLMKQQSELLNALPDMELGMELDAAAEGPAAAAAPRGAAAAAEARSDALAERGTARARQDWEAPASRGGAVAMQLSFGHAGGGRDDPAAQHTRGAVGPAEGSQPAAFQGTGGAGGEGSAGGGFCFARSPLQPRVAPQVSSPARDLGPRDRRRGKRKRGAQRLLGPGPGQGLLGSEVEQVGGRLHSHGPPMLFAEVLELGLCHGLPLATVLGGGLWPHVCSGTMLSEVCCRLIVNDICIPEILDSPALQATHLPHHAV